ncbi:MAG: leucine-rich repeat protein [Oscillospiraceae bacterium]
MKRIYILLTAFLTAAFLLLSALPTVRAQAATSGAFSYTVLSDGTARITSYNGSASSVTVPKTIAGHTVTRIGDGAFIENTRVKTVTLPATVTRIEGDDDADGAFYGCTNLKTINFPDKLTYIGYYAFQQCTSLTSLSFGAKLTQISPYAFIGCSGITKVTFGAGLKKIGEFAFAGCTKLSTAKLPASITDIGAGAFFGDKLLKAATLPKTLKSIGNYALGFAYQSGTGYVRYSGFTLTYSTNTAAQAYVDAFKVTAKEIVIATSLAKCTVTPAYTATTFSGAAKQPSVTVKNGTATLKRNTDYTVSYSANTNAGTATVTVKGMGRYTGSVTKTFVINPANLQTLSLQAVPDQIYTGGAITPAVVTSAGKTLTAGTDYTAVYTANWYPGTAAVKLTGKGNYTGALTRSFSVLPAPADALTFTEIPMQLYTGEALTPPVIVTYGALTLAEGTDYTVTYQNNTDAGTAQAIVTLTGNYAGTKTLSFAIGSTAAFLNVTTHTQSGAMPQAGILLLFAAVTPALRRRLKNRLPALRRKALGGLAAVTALTVCAAAAADYINLNAVTASALSAAARAKASQIKITLDPGHVDGYNQFGYYAGVSEGTQMWKLSVYLKAELESYGFVVVTTRPDIDDNPDLDVRGTLAGKNGSDLFISLHSNAVAGATRSSASGVEIYYSMSDAAANKVFANKLGSAAASAMGIEFDGSKTRTYPGTSGVDYYGVIRYAATTGCKAAFLIEQGYHTSAKDSAFLVSSEKLKTLAKAEAKAIAQYYGII